MRAKPIIHFPNRTTNKRENIINGEVSPNTRRSIAEEYYDGRMSLHIHERWKGEEYCAIFNRSIGVTIRNAPSQTLQNKAHLTPKVASSEQKVSVLISVTKLMEIPQIPPVFTRTVARLKRIHDGNYCVGHPLELSPLSFVIFGNAVKDGEFVVGGRVIPLRQNQLLNKVVKSTSEVVKNFSNTQTEVVRKGRHFDEAVDLLSRCRIILTGDSIRLEIGEGRQITAQCIMLLGGPGKFSKGAINGGHIAKVAELQADHKAEVERIFSKIESKIAMVESASWYQALKASVEGKP